MISMKLNFHDLFHLLSHQITVKSNDQHTLNVYDLFYLFSLQITVKSIGQYDIKLT